MMMSLLVILFNDLYLVQAEAQNLINKWRVSFNISTSILSISYKILGMYLFWCIPLFYFQPSDLHRVEVFCEKL